MEESMFEEKINQKLKNKLMRDEDRYLKFLNELQEEPTKNRSKDRSRDQMIEELLESNERRELLETLLEHPFVPFPRRVENNDLHILLIKEPDNLEKALENLKAHRPIQEFIQEGKDEDPSTSYHYNQIDSWDAVLDSLLDVYERNKTIPGVVAFKIKAAFSIQVEYHSKTPGHGSAPGSQGDHVRYALSLGQENKGSLIPYTIRLSSWKDEYENYSKYLHVEVQKMLEHMLDASSTMYIGITGISFHIAVFETWELCSLRWSSFE
jgi:hypothetical protein